MRFGKLLGVVLALLVAAYSTGVADRGAISQSSTPPSAGEIGQPSTRSSPEQPAGAGDRQVGTSPFAGTSFWTLPQGKDVPLDPQSDTYVADLVDQVNDNEGQAVLNHDEYSVPIYEVGADAERIDLEYSNCQNKSYVNPAVKQQLADVPLVDWAKPAPGRDGAMVVYQSATDTMWDLWRVERDDGEIAACWGGRLEDVSESQGVYSRPWGTSASGLALYSSVARIEELQAGEIDHMVGLSLPRVRAGDYVWPANRTDGNAHGEQYIPEGQRFRLDPDLEIDALDLHPIARTYAEAVQEYGLVLRDRSGVVTFGAENAMGSTEEDPYVELLDGTPRYEVFDGFPWEHLQAIDPEWGQELGSVEQDG